MNAYGDKTAKDYALKRDIEAPRRKYMLYPSWLDACGDIADKRVLDVGCGNGVSSRLLAEREACVIALDASNKQLEIAAKTETEEPLGIIYFQSDMAEMPQFYPQFDLITASLSLHYCSTQDMLRNTLQNIADNLKSGGSIVALNQNPEQPTDPGFDHASAISEWVDPENKWQNGAKIKVQLINPDGERLSSFINYYWSKKTYEHILQSAGFTNIEWIPLQMKEEGKKIVDNWRQLEDESSIIVLKATKK